MGDRPRATVGLAAIPIAGLAAFFAYGGGFPNRDATWTLVWGRQILHLDTPELAAGPTPHPLSNALGVLAAAVHPASEAVLLVVGYGAVGGLVVAAFAIGSRLFGVAVGVLAAALVATRDTLLFYGALAYVDVIFAAPVLWAIALEAGRPKRGVPVLALLAVAGLARPEAWLLAAAYWLYARPPDRGEAMRWAALAAAAPLLWALLDLLATGDLLFSFTSTRDDAAETGRPSGLDGLLTEGPRIVARTARPDVCIAAAIGLVVAHREGRAGLLAGAIAATALATAVPIAAGTALNDRYLMTTMALLCVAAAVPLTLVVRREAGPWRVAGVASLAVLAVGVVDHAPRFVERRDSVVDRDARRTAAHDAVRPGVPCYPLVMPNQRLIADAASWLDVPLDAVRDGRLGIPRGSYLWGTEAAMKDLLVIAGRPGAAAPAPPAPVIRTRGGWTLTALCAR